MTVDFLLPKFKEEKLDLEGVFLLAQSIMHSDKSQEEIATNAPDGAVK